MLSQDELVESIINAMDLLESGNSALNKLAAYLYKADNQLPEFLDKLQTYTELETPTRPQTQEAGKLLEQIVLLLFKGLKGVQSTKSFQSAGPQYDLLVSGDDISWKGVCKTLYLEWEQRDIVVEAKATREPLPHKQFARLCSIMEHHLRGAGLGIFVTLNGASGFPKRGDSRKRKASDCRLTQVVFHAKTNKIIVVLDKEDLLELTKNGSLIEVLTRKIRDLSELSGLPTAPVDNYLEKDLPPHLQKLDESNN
ncbi:hypothetical protein MEN41_04825 [Dolichospermum sp. ST_con]|nr:hypothetical protein [Dolichospermum sp. ST_con]MDD1419701.1 hypothetical protein [Dolichospermum sp. ST_sed1]MDD1425090.1 hypothetical protein [Dolichospermum sp. ST_sed9]MDD1431846.1 hypothetical protein [Dolichospermum sp. ST_sed6]MDD1436839.1 hypothetical protein [Dolichospermum sp. ST_sed10]MDD1446568.1 hypothetical protein [Dolichospermum sp. ST_sed8]MDD1455583.1 hypothetical protein [Dolichospermum sp. ST_sed7]MDD1461113.1 hypothetical protein [Dolichospermum sp. ST_sed2]MDD146534